MNNNNKNLQEADVSTFGALLPVAAVGLAAGGYLAAKGIGSFRNFLANRAKKKSDAAAAAAPVPTPVPAPAPVPVDKSAKIARIAARKKARREEEAEYTASQDKQFGSIISTYGEVGRAVGASKIAAAATAAARQAALDKAQTDRQDKIATSALTRDERLAQIAADAAAKAGERQTAKDTTDAARADKALEYGKNKDEPKAQPKAQPKAEPKTPAPTSAPVRVRDERTEEEKREDAEAKNAARMAANRARDAAASKERNASKIALAKPASSRPVKKLKPKEQDGLTPEQTKIALAIQREGLKKKQKEDVPFDNMTDSTQYYVTSILKNLLG